MLQKIDVSKARNELSTLMEKVYFDGQKFILLRWGIPMTVMTKITEAKEMIKPSSAVRVRKVTGLFGIWKKRKGSTLELADYLRRKAWESHAD